MTSTIKLFAALSIFVWLLAGEACAATTVVIRASVKDCNSQRCLPPSLAYGSGVVIGDMQDGSTAVLTAAHVVRDTSDVFVCNSDNEWVPARVVAAQKNDDIDIALLSTSLGEVRCGYLVDGQSDSDVELTGYVPQRGWRKVRGRIVVRDRRVYGVVAEQGESGCPVSSGDAIHGIVWGHDGQSTLVTESYRIRWWLKSRVGYIPSCGSPPPEAPTPPANRDPIIIDVPGCDCKNYDAEIAAIRSEIKAMKTPIRVQIQRDGKVVDEDTYDVFNGQPIVLNFKKKTSQPQSAAGK